MFSNPEQVKWTQPHIWHHNVRFCFDPLPNRFRQHPQNHFLGTICRTVYSVSQPTAGGFSVEFETFAWGFSVRCPALDSRTRLSSVGVCQQKLRQSKYLNQIEKVFGQLFRIHLESALKKSVKTIDVSCSSRKMSWFISSTMTRSFFWMAFRFVLTVEFFLQLFPIEVGRLKFSLVYCSVDSPCLLVTSMFLYLVSSDPETLSSIWFEQSTLVPCR